jgi:hypothetical protein
MGGPQVGKNAVSTLLYRIEIQYCIGQSNCAPNGIGTHGRSSAQCAALSELYNGLLCSSRAMPWCVVSCIVIVYIKQ